MQDQKTKRARFKKLATLRTNQVLYRLKVLGNCSNKSFYYYSDEDIKKIFSAIEEQVRTVKAKFKRPKQTIKL
jgi:hypothetical protein